MKYAGDDLGGEGSSALPEATAERPRRRRRSLRIADVFGIELSIHWSWLIIAAVLTSSLAVLWLPAVQPSWTGTLRWPVACVCALFFFTSLLLHELSHALMARRRGVEVLGITLFLLGGVAKLGAEPRTARDEFLIAVVGPLASFALSILFGGTLWGADALRWETLGTVAFYLTLANAMIGVFNLLPGFPLDGGRILRAGLWAFTRDFRKATRIAGWAGRGMAVAMVGFGAWLLLRQGALGGAWMVVLGVFLWWAARNQMPPLHEQPGGAF